MSEAMEPLYVKIPATLMDKLRLGMKQNGQTQKFIVIRALQQYLEKVE